MLSLADLPLFEDVDTLEQLLHEVRDHLVMQQFPDRLLSVKEACTMLNVSRSTLYTLMDARELAYVDAYGRRIPLSAVLNYIETHTRQGDAVYSVSAARRKENE